MPTYVTAAILLGWLLLVCLGLGLIVGLRRFASKGFRIVERFRGRASVRRAQVLLVIYLLIGGVLATAGVPATVQNSQGQQLPVEGFPQLVALFLLFALLWPYWFLILQLSD